MTWPFENDTRKIEKKLAIKSFQANRTRNIIAIISIILTTILFTGLFTLQRGLTESTERADMILSGGDGHARIIDLNQSEYDTISTHPLIHEIAYCRTLAESVDNTELSKRETLFLYYDDNALKYNLIFSLNLYFSLGICSFGPIAVSSFPILTKTFPLSSLRTVPVIISYSFSLYSP